MKKIISIVSILFVLTAFSQEYSYHGKPITEQEFNKIYSVFSKFYGVDENGTIFNTSRKNLPDPEIGEAFLLSLHGKLKEGFHEFVLSEREIKIKATGYTLRGIYAGGGSYYKKIPVVLQIKASDTPLPVEFPVIVTKKDNCILSGKVLKTPTREQFRVYIANKRLFRYRKEIKRGSTFFCEKCNGSGKEKKDTIAAKFGDGECRSCGGTGKNKIPDRILFKKRYL